MKIPECVKCGIQAAFPKLVKEPYTCLTCQEPEQPEAAATAEAKGGSHQRVVSRPREITPDDVTKEADRNYDLGRKHGHEEKADLLDWAETLLCNALPMPHCTQEDWDAAVKKWRDEKHGEAKSANARMSEGGRET